MNRKNILLKNISLGILFKALNMVIVFLTIPFLLNYLEEEKYGIWVTIFSVVNVVFFIDGGIGNGLKTKLSKAISLKDNRLSKSYITTAYAIISSISVIVFSVLAFLIYFLDLKDLLNTSLSNSELKLIFFVTLIMICMGFVLSLYKSFFYAIHEASKIELSMLIYQVLILSSVFMLLNYFESNILYVALTYGVSNIIIGLSFTLFFFKKRPELKPNIKSFEKNKIKGLLSLSVEFFIIQLSLIVILSTDNLIISNILGPEEVASYDVVYRLFTLLITLTIILQDPFWALYTDAYTRKDFNWIKGTIKKLNLVFIPLTIVVFILYHLSDFLIKTWLHRDLNISNNLILFTSIYVLTRIYSVIYTQFLNAIGKIKLQMWLYVLGALVNIPLSYFFVKKMNLGNSGVVLGTFFSILSVALVLPLQTYKILNNR